MTTGTILKALSLIPAGIGLLFVFGMIANASSGQDTAGTAGGAGLLFLILGSASLGLWRKGDAIQKEETK